MKEERGDLIKFYNTVYVGRVKSFALRYDLSNQDHVVCFIFYYDMNIYSPNWITMSLLDKCFRVKVSLMHFIGEKKIPIVKRVIKTIIQHSPEEIIEILSIL